MSLNSILENGGISLIIILTLIQISPIKINPWSKILQLIGRAINKEILEIIKEDNADSRRYRILRFDDEIRHDKEEHTEEHFVQILKDIDEYEKYCKEHPGYKNSRAVSAIKNIKRVYEKCRRDNSFLV